eukprot:tig00000944_g5967.t1
MESFSGLVEERVAAELLRLGFSTHELVVSGVSAGLPNAGRAVPVCDPENVMRLMRGENFIVQLADSRKREQLEMNVVQVVKDTATGERKRHVISGVHEVLQVAGVIGDLDLCAEYGIPPHIVETLDSTYQLAIAAGLEALAHAGIELDTHHVPTEHGNPHLKHPKRRWGPLPAALQASTGVIFASSFPALDSMVEEVSRFVAHRLTESSRKGIIERLSAYSKTRAGSEQPSDATAQLESYLQSLTVEPSGDEASMPGSYSFNRKLLFQILVMANAQLAELIHARGPNTQINAACASTAQAIALAEDWIRVGRCERVVVVSGDNATSDNLLRYIGTGFMALGAACTQAEVEAAALPFDARRSGMVLGAGAVGLVIESEVAALRRGARPLCRLLGSHIANSAFHASLLDAKHISSELDVFLTRMERRHGISRSDIADSCIYMSHETFTCARGGCAKVEIDALRSAFLRCPGGISRITIANTKGFTAHPMGVGIEDAVAVECLHHKLVPPIANFKQSDPCLGGDLNLSHGGHLDARFCLRFAAGFGSHFVYLLYASYSSPSPSALRALAMESTAPQGAAALAAEPDSEPEHKKHAGLASFPPSRTPEREHSCTPPCMKQSKRKEPSLWDDGFDEARRRHRWHGKRPDSSSSWAGKGNMKRVNKITQQARKAKEPKLPDLDILKGEHPAATVRCLDTSGRAYHVRLGDFVICSTKAKRGDFNYSVNGVILRRFAAVAIANHLIYYSNVTVHAPAKVVAADEYKALNTPIPTSTSLVNVKIPVAGPAMLENIVAQVAHVATPIDPKTGQPIRCSRSLRRGASVQARLQAGRGREGDPEAQRDADVTVEKAYGGLIVPRHTGSHDVVQFDERPGRIVATKRSGRKGGHVTLELPSYEYGPTASASPASRGPRGCPVKRPRRCRAGANTVAKAPPVPKQPLQNLPPPPCRPRRRPAGPRRRRPAAPPPPPCRPPPPPPAARPAGRRPVGPAAAAHRPLPPYLPPPHPPRSPSAPLPSPPLGYLLA